MFKRLYSEVDLTSYDFFPKFLVDVQSGIAILISQILTFCSGKVSMSKLVSTVNYCLLFEITW